MDPSRLVQEIAAYRTGSVIAAAGCGKTECITDVVAASRDRRLVLTHTLAGVDVLRDRLKSKGVHGSRFALDTIAAWSLKFTHAFPVRAELSIEYPQGDDWHLVYKAATRLVARGSITSVLRASYRGVLVDEYQDCTIAQHALFVELMKYLPVCIFRRTPCRKSSISTTTRWSIGIGMCCPTFPNWAS